MSITDELSATPRIQGSDSSLAEWAENLADRIQAGERVDLSGLARESPERAEELRRLLPAIELMAEFGRSAATSAGAGAASSPAPGPTMTHELGVLGDFRIVREVGRGGMGVVYEAEQVSLRRRVALKILPFAAAMDPSQLQRFQLEAQAAACLHHTNIVPVHAVGSERGVPFYAMQFIEGRSLAQVITELRRLDGLDGGDDPAPRPAGGSPAFSIDLTTSSLAASLVSGKPKPERAAAVPVSPTVEHTTDDTELKPSSGVITTSNTPLSRNGGPSSSASSTHDRAYIENVAELGLQAAEALDHAHDRGILHRDIKPANLMLDAAGHLWVTDFGLAQIRGDSRLTPTGDVLGTLRYMSPEQATGRRVLFDGRTDVYSLGVSLYELLTLRPAIDGRDRVEILRRVVHEDPPPLRSLNPAIPRDLETIVQKAMAKEPESRYATAGELANDLRRFLEDRPIGARRPGVPERAVRWLRRHPSVAAATAIVLVLALLASVLSTVLISREQRLTAMALAEVNLRLKESDFWNLLVYVQTSPFSGGGGTLTYAQILDLAEQRVAEEFRDEPVVEARLRTKLGTILRMRHQLDRAYRHVVRAVDLFREHLGDDHRETLEARKARAVIMMGQNRAFAIGELREVLAMQRRSLPPDDKEVVDTIRWLVASLFPESRPEAVRLAMQTVETSRRVFGPDDAVTLMFSDLLANDAASKGEFERAIRLFTEVVTGFEKTPGGALNGDALAARDSRGGVRWASGDLRGALQDYQQARDGFWQVWKDEIPRTFRCEWIPQLLLRYLGEHRAAAVELEALLEKWTRVKGEGHDYVLAIKAILALDRGDLATARRYLEEIWPRRVELEGAMPSIDIGRAFAESLAWGGDHEKAVEIANGVLVGSESQIGRGGYSEKHYHVAVARDLVASMLVSTPGTGFASHHASRAMELARKNVAYFPSDGLFRTTLGIVQYRAGRWDEAIATLEEANRLDEFRRFAPRGFFQAMAHWRKGEPKKAFDLFHQSAAWMDEQRPHHPELLQARVEAAALLDLTTAESKITLPADPFAR